MPITKLIPPWIKFPDYTYGCLGWRMGAGEDYINEFTLFIQSLSNEAKEKYIEENPLPKEWDGFWLYR